MGNPPAIVFLSIPGLRVQDVSAMPNLRSIVESGTSSRIEHSFPAVTWPSQATMLTGCQPSEHGVIANGFYWRDKRQVEMWTAWNEVIQRPQIWDVLKERSPESKSLAWFPMLSKGCGANYVCMPAPIHQPDGSEDLWCYTRPQEFYGQLIEQLDHFPLQHFWGPLANINSSQWIADSLLLAAEKFLPIFSYVYLPHLDYAAQKIGPDSAEAAAAVGELDDLIGRLGRQLPAALKKECVWIVASEYVITPVDHVAYPNRILRQAGLLDVIETDGEELIDFENSAAWAMVDHQFSHVFVRDRDEKSIAKVEKLFESRDGFDVVVSGSRRAEVGMEHDRSGDVILISTANSWQAYYWWLDDNAAPKFARTVDIHRKPGYDPIELHFDFATKSVPLDATLAAGSHGAPVKSESQMGVLLTSAKADLREKIADTAIFGVVLKELGIG